MTDRVPSSGSCRRCQRALGLASVKRDGAWYCCVESAEGRTCLADDRVSEALEARLAPVPRRHFAPRFPKELRRESRKLR
ncbi:MAG: hypothetical protein AAF430_03270 [Myxococcota bacterium]